MSVLNALAPRRCTVTAGPVHLTDSVSNDWARFVGFPMQYLLLVSILSVTYVAIATVWSWLHYRSSHSLLTTVPEKRAIPELSLYDAVFNRSRIQHWMDDYGCGGEDRSAVYQYPTHSDGLACSSILQCVEKSIFLSDLPTIGPCGTVCSLGKTLGCH